MLTATKTVHQVAIRDGGHSIVGCSAKEKASSNAEVLIEGRYMSPRKTSNAWSKRDCCEWTAKEEEEKEMKSKTSRK